MTDAMNAMDAIRRTAALAKYVLSLAQGKDEQAAALEELATYIDSDSAVTEFLNAVIPQIRRLTGGIDALITWLNDAAPKLHLGDYINVDQLKAALTFAAYAEDGLNGMIPHLVKAAKTVVNSVGGQMYNAICVWVIHRALEILLDYGEITSDTTFTAGAVAFIDALTDDELTAAIENEPTWLRSNNG